MRNDGDGIHTGLCCAILKDFDLVKDDDCFKSFDT